MKKESSREGANRRKRRGPSLLSELEISWVRRLICPIRYPDDGRLATSFNANFMRDGNRFIYC